MDKNTTNALLLMLLVFFLFMWLSPKPDAPQQQQAEAPETVTQTAVNTSVDSLTGSDREWLVKNIVEHGTRVPGETPAYRLNQNGVNLTLTGNQISGTVTVEGRDIEWADIANADTARMTVAEQNQAIQAVRNLTQDLGRYGSFARFLAGSPQTVRMENDALKLEFNTHSGTITRAELKKYDTEYNSDETAKTKHKVVLFEGDRNSFNFDLPLPNAVATSELYFTPRQLNDSTLLMALDFGPDAYWGLRYTLPKGENYVVKVDVVQHNMADKIQSNNRTMLFSWNQDMHRQEKGRMYEERNSALYYKYAGGSVENLSEGKDDTEERKAKIKWIGFKNQFFSTVIIYDKGNFNMADFKSTVLTGSDYLKNMQAEAKISDYDWSKPVPVSLSLFMGPNLYPLLSSLDHKVQTDEDLKLTRMIPLGWNIFRWINTGVIIPCFNVLSKFISNYGIIILLLTIFIKLILFPLTYKSYRSQAVMRVLSPEITTINDKWPGTENAMLRQQKTMELYRKAGASPMSGCLPLLLQMPVLFAMFSFFPSCIELRGQSFLWAHDLSAPDAIVSWSGDIPLVTKYFGNHISLFCLLMTGTNILYTYLNSQTQANTMPGMKVMMYLMPLMFLVFFNNYSAALSYYLFISLLITIIQTYSFRFVIKEESVRKMMAKNASKPRKKSKWQARLEEMQRQQQQMLREQQKQQRRR